MTRFAVVGHVEWIEFGTFDHVPEPGEIIDADEWFSEAAGSAAVVGVQLAKLSGGVVHLTPNGERTISMSVDETLAFAARAGAANLTGRGPYEGQLTTT
jgi:ribokinase